MADQRYKYIDLGAGLMILWMIMGHAVNQASMAEIIQYGLWGTTGVSALPEGLHARLVSDGSVDIIGLGYYIPNLLFFFMQWFFYKSGQFFTKRSIREEWKKDWSKLIVQFVIWSVVGYVLYVVLLGFQGGLTLRNATYSIVRGFFLNGYIPLNYPLWFLFSLFVVKQVANVVLPQKDDRYFHLKCALVVLCSFAIGFGAYLWKHPFFPKWVANGSVGLAFFSMGYWLSKYETQWWLIVLCIFVYIPYLIWGLPTYGSVGAINNTCDSIVGYLASLPVFFAGIVVFNGTCRLITKYLPHISVPFEMIGKYAMIIYVSHGLFSEGIPTILATFDLTSFMSFRTCFWIIVIAYVVCLPIFCFMSKKIKY